MEGRPTLSDSLLEVKLRHRVGTLLLDVEFSLAQPWTVLFGPSGSGKTTVLRAIAGFVRPDDGQIVARLDGRELVMSDSGRGVFVKPHLRPVRVASQAVALFPHMTVRGNIAFGAASSEVVEAAIARFRIGDLAEKLPPTLSGGERQRVAIARAVAAAVSVEGGSILLLDEPFTGLDLRLREELIEELTDWLRESRTPVLSVTHYVGEAFQLGAEVIKISDGRVARRGPASEVLAGERERLLEQLRERSRA